MMADTPVTALSYALLGLIGQAPRSGYRLRLVFETTPLGAYSSSPGSIYPAIKRLENVGFIYRDAADLRRPVFHLTDKGATALRTWLEQPVDPEEVADSRETALLRFAFLQDHPERGLSLSYLDGFAAASAAHADRLEAFLAGEEGRALSLQSRLAVEHGLAGARSSALWARKARERLEAELKGEEES